MLSFDRSNRRRGRRRSPCAPRPAAEVLELRAVPAGGVAVAYTLVQDWGSGFQSRISLTNNGTTTVKNWTLEFDDPGVSIDSIWDAAVVSRAGAHYVVKNAGWNADIAPGTSASFGYTGSPGRPAAPTNFVVNGATAGGGGNGPSLSIDDVSLVEGNSGTTNAVFTVKLSAAATATVTVGFGTADGTANAGADYTRTTGSLTFAAGQTTKTVSVPVIGDGSYEPDETFAVILSNPVGATIADNQGIATIRNDDPAPASDATFVVTSDWGSGFQGRITVTNRSATDASDWTLEFDWPNVTVNSIWDAKIAARTGNHDTIAPLSYDMAIPAGGSVTFGFTAAPGNVSVGPANFALHLVSGGGGGGGSTGNHAPTAANDLLRTSPGTPATIAVLANDTDADGDTLSLKSVGSPAHGATKANADGTVTYTPAPGYTGTDSFTYVVADGKGGTANGTVSVTVASPIAWPAHVFAPYVDVTLYPMFDMVAVAKDQGLRFFSLAFITADPQGNPAWGGYAEYGVAGGSTFEGALQQQIAGIRALGGDVVPSFGGAAGQELAQTITDVAKLKAAYRKVVDAYDLTHVDFDIEGAAAAEHASIDRRSQALAALQKDLAAVGRNLDISLTLPVLPTGLTADGLYVVQSAVKAGVKISVVNVMAMDYGDSAAPNPQGKMGDYAIQADNSLFTQLQGVYGTSKTSAQLWGMVGLTPMIGLNDVTTEVFDQIEAREVLAFAQQKGIGRLAFWSLNRDRRNSAGRINWVDIQSSSILQQPYEFSTIFKPFTG